MVLSLCCLADISTQTRDCGSKYKQKSGVETRMRLAVNTDILPAIPAVNLVPNGIACIHLDLVGTAESGRAYVWTALGFHIPSLRLAS